MKWLTAPFEKALSAMRHAARPVFWAPTLKRTRFDYKSAVGDGLDSSVVTAPIQWVARALPEARLTVYERQRDGGRKERADHPMLDLIRRPNDYYGDNALFAATIFSYLIDGNAYWLKLRNGLGQPAELWYVPHWTIEPKWPDDGSVFISHYLYSPGGGVEPMRLSPDDVVHFRHGIDPRNPRKGIAPLAGVLREIFMDLESSNFVASLLRNMGVPGVVLAPKTGGSVSPDDVNATKTWFKQAFGGDNRGDALVMGAPTEVHQFGFNPQQMNMSEARDVAEERVCACLGIPPAVVGFGAGLQSTKVGATMAEMVKLAWRNGVMPVAGGFADELGRSLLPDFSQAERLEAGWDSSEVLALQEDQDKKSTRVLEQMKAGLITVAAAQEELGYSVDESQRFYLRPAMSFEVPEGVKPNFDLSSNPAAKALTLIESKARAPRAARRAGAIYVRALQQQEDGQTRAMDGKLKKFFTALGKDAAKTARPMLDAEDFGSKDRTPDGEKADELLIARILDGLDIAAHRTAFQQLYETHYLNVAKDVQKAAELAGISGSLPDPVARSIAGAGGRRAGLIDLERQSKAALFDAIAEARAEGLGVSGLAGRIAEHVEAGPWSSIETRARTIARTETKYAQNVSTVERAKAAGVKRFIVFDGRLGPGRSDPDHIARDGSVVTAQEADQMAIDEHPNGTLSFAPYFGD